MQAPEAPVETVHAAIGEAVINAVGNQISLLSLLKPWNRSA
jgi:hypothetical protein